MDLWTRKTLQSLLVPGGLLLFAAVALLQGGLLAISATAVDFCYYAVFATALLLAWRFHSSRIMFAAITLLLAHRAMEFFSDGHLVHSGPGRIALEAVAVMLPLNFIVFSSVRERGLAVPAVASRLMLVFSESVLVAILCRPGQIASPWIFHVSFLGPRLFPWARIPQTALCLFALAVGILLFRLLLHRKPTENGLLWSLVAAFAGLQCGGVGRLSSAYFAAAGLVLVVSVVENSYLLAYHDELTTLPGRRAFNEALPALQATYTIAVVDIDHFKNFNDTWGHDTGDQVLRMVAARLARVGGGGHAYRVGGEEFSILFPEKPMKEVIPHLDSLRALIQASTFQVRGIPERRTAARGSDRRQENKKRKARRAGSDQARNPELPFVEHLSVTVSIGVAEPTGRMGEAEQVIDAADKALYRAKQAGRNRIEVAGPPRRSSRLKRSIA